MAMRFEGWMLSLEGPVRDALSVPLVSLAFSSGPAARGSVPAETATLTPVVGATAFDGTALCATVQPP